GTLVVRLDVSDARIELDGQLIATAAAGARLKVDAGEHALTVLVPGKHPYTGRVVVGPGSVVELPLHLHRDDATAARARGSVPAAAVKSAARSVAPAAKSADKATPDKPADKRKDPDYLVDPFSGPK